MTEELGPLEEIAYEIRQLANEVKLLREAWLASPTQEINSIMLANLKAQMGGGIMPATILPPKGH